MSRQKIQLGSSKLVREAHPIDTSVDPNVVLNDAATASCSFRVYDPAADETLTVAAATSAVTLNVTDPGDFAIGYSVEIALDDGTFDIDTVNAVDVAAGTIGITTGLTSGAAIGQRVRRIFGTAVTMTEYGTASLSTTDWGYQGTYPGDHVSQIVGQDIDIQVDFIGTSSDSSLNKTKVWLLTIVDGDDC